ncbi:MAG: hypothetical protein CMJ24_09760 [Phycisphaerae bacterium]|nr:hypothetical protein [Phycisphaerae bacterium]|tara:strand:+ start:402 stop:1541 length:1140 start_codon:yes stop_codon:yes gene_type:complete
MTDIADMKLSADQLARSSGRIDRLRQRLAAEGHSAMIIDHEIDIWYLTGFVGHDATLVITTDVAAILCDARYEEYLRPWKDGGVHEVHIGPRQELVRRIREVAQACDVGTFAFQAEHMTVARLQQFRSQLEGIDFISSHGHLLALRMIKDDHEVGIIEHCIDIQQRALHASFEQLERGMTESGFTAILEFEMRKLGATGAGFDPIVASGPNSSVIHHMPCERPIGDGPLLVDWGARYDGYCSDMTRTFQIGPADGKMAELYDIVLRSQLAAIEACRPGADCAEVDAAARDVIASSGYGENFPHGLGHGLGMEVHEAPNFSAKQAGVLLEPGMVMTVEPGIYIPGFGGIRIEDDVLITETGHRVLSDMDKSAGSVPLNLR